MQGNITQETAAAAYSQTACRCFLAKILKFPFNLEVVLAQSTQGQHLYTDNTHANCLL